MPLNADGSLREFTAAEIAAFEIEWTGVRDGSTPTLRLEQNQSTQEASVFCKWEQRLFALEYFLGRSLVYTDAGGTKRISRLLPYRAKKTQKLAVTKITSCTGHAFRGLDSDEEPRYEKAKISLLFEHCPFDLLTDQEANNKEYLRFLELGDVDPTSDALTFPGGTMSFKKKPTDDDPTGWPNGVPVPWNWSKVVPVEKFRTVWWKVPYSLYNPNSTWFKRLYGTGASDDVPYYGAINKSEIFSRPPGTVYLAAVKPIRDKDPTGEGGYSLRVEFEWWYRPSGWNKLYVASKAHPRKAGFYFATTGANYHEAGTLPDKESLYDARNLLEVFEP